MAADILVACMFHVPYLQAEQRVSELNRQKVELESKLEDDQEDLNEIVTKHKNTLQQVPRILIIITG